MLFEEAAQNIKEKYIDKALDYMAGKSTKMVSNKEYMRVYAIVMAQCD
jgi:hypothetical protein